MDRLLIPVNEAAQQLGIGRSSLYLLMDSGEIASMRIGRRRLFVADSLREYVERNLGNQQPRAEVRA